MDRQAIEAKLIEMGWTWGKKPNLARLAREVKTSQNHLWDTINRKDMPEPLRLYRNLSLVLGLTMDELWPEDKNAENDV